MSEFSRVGANTLTFASVGYIKLGEIFSDAENNDDETITVKHFPGASFQIIVAAATIATRSGKNVTTNFRFIFKRMQDPPAVVIKKYVTVKNVKQGFWKPIIPNSQDFPRNEYQNIFSTQKTLQSDDAPNSFKVPYSDSDEDIEMPTAEPTRVVKERKAITKPKVFRFDGHDVQVVS